MSYSVKKLTLVIVLLTFLIFGISACMSLNQGVDINGVKIAIGDVTLESGSTSEVKISVVNPPDVKTIQVGPTGKFTFDQTVVNVSNVTGLNGFQILASNIDNTNGEVTFAGGFPGSSVGPIKERDTDVVRVGIPIVKITLQAVGGGTSALGITQVDVLSDRNNNDITVKNILNGEATIG